MNTIVLAAQAAQGGGSMGFLLFMVAVFAIMWFFMIRPQQKKQKKIREFQNALQEGSKVVICFYYLLFLRFLNISIRIRSKPSHDPRE